MRPGPAWTNRRLTASEESDDRWREAARYGIATCNAAHLTVVLCLARDIARDRQARACGSDTLSGLEAATITNLQEITMANRSSQPAPEGPPSQPHSRTGTKPAGAADADAGGFVERKYEESTYPETGLGNGDDPKASQDDDRTNDKARRAATRKGIK